MHLMPETAIARTGLRLVAVVPVVLLVLVLLPLVPAGLMCRATGRAYIRRLSRDILAAACALMAGTPMPETAPVSNADARQMDSR